MDTNLVVLDDSLYKQLHNYRHNIVGEFSQDLISKIHRYAGNGVLTNLRQIDECKLEIDDALRKVLSYQKNKKADLPELAKDAFYKIILTDDNSKKDFPYVNIREDLIRPVLGGFFKANVSRKKGIAHLKALCSKGKEFIIYDTYLSKEGNVTANASILDEILPSGRNITITYQSRAGDKDAHFSEDLIAALKVNTDKRYVFEDKMLPEHHDRYIIVDNKVEIIITSGFDYLHKISKEVSYIVRPYSPDNRFG